MPTSAFARHRGLLECSIPKARLARIYCVLDVNFRMLNILSSSIRVQSYEELSIYTNFTHNTTIHIYKTIDLSLFIHSHNS